MRTRRLVSALALLLLIAPAVAAVAMQCGIRPCPMAESSMGCMHTVSLEEDRSKHDEMPCCEKAEEAIASLQQAPSKCCSISEQDTPDAISIKRFQPEEPSDVAVSDAARVAEAPIDTASTRALILQPRPGPSLFTLHSSFLI